MPHDAGRVLRDGAPSPGEYVAGWIKRGPTGVVGTNKHDARETVASLLADAAAGVLRPQADGDWVDTLVRDPVLRPTGGRSTPRRSPSAPPTDGPAPPCTNASRCWPPSAPRLPLEG